MPSIDRIELPVGLKVEPLEFEYDVRLHPKGVEALRAMLNGMAGQHWRLVQVTAGDILVFERIKYREPHPPV